jgi:tripartite-type tricarboxylate transporter receptor subunit TctC
MRARMQTFGLDPAGGTPKKFAAFVKNDIARWAKVIKEAGVYRE